jgi:hypothetical protein
LTLLLCVSFPAGAPGQEPDRPTPAPADSVVGELEGELTGTLADSTADERFPHIAGELRPPSEGWSWATHEWDRQAILRSNAMTLLDLLSEAVPGFTALRATWFGGPHQAAVGALGAGFVTVSLDGRELTSVDAGQVDLTRIALAEVESVRVRRRADGWVAELTSLRRSKRTAYSRITGGTGEPGLSRLRLVFGNGIGKHFNLGTSIDLLDAEGDNASSNFNFWGRVEWLPGDGDAGLEFHWMSESVERDVYQPAEFNRREIFLRGRGNLGEHVQAEAFVGRSGLSEGGESVRDFSNGGFRLSGGGDRAWFRTGFRLWNDPIFPILDADLELGYRVLSWLTLSAGGRMGTWDEFDTSEARAGLAAEIRPLGLTITADGATGRRGVSYPTLERTDSVSFDVGAAGLALRLGPFTLSGRGEYQKLNRQLPFGAAFDREQTAGGPVELGIGEVGLDVPLVPLGLVLNEVSPIRVRGFWRTTEIIEGTGVLYLPLQLARGELFWHDSFFGDELEIQGAFGLNRRGSMLTPSSPAAGSDPVAISGYTFVDWNLMIRILDVRVYWRLENLTLQQGAADFPGLPFPLRRSVFGVKWEFLN